LQRHVRGILFLDYVRMLRSQKNVPWADHLQPEDQAFLLQKIDPSAWYPMETFERMGNAILKLVARDTLAPVQMWGRYSANQLRAANPLLLEPNDPVETLNRFRVMRETFFDFPALEVLELHEGTAYIVVRYHMGKLAEEAASFQTLGFFEGLLQLAGAKEIKASFKERSWAGDPRTQLELHWVS
jgi:hypothetical protein